MSLDALNQSAELGDFFAPKRRARQTTPQNQQASTCSVAVSEMRFCCRVCHESITMTQAEAQQEAAVFGRSSAIAVTQQDQLDSAEYLCDACERHEKAWAKVRCWVCLHDLVAKQRAYPLQEVEWCTHSSEVCTSWDEEDAVERAVLAHAAKLRAVSQDALKAATFGTLSAYIVGLPTVLLARVLEFAYDGAREVFAPPLVVSERSHANLWSGKWLQALAAAGPRRRRRCTQILLERGSCLHGRIVHGPRRTCVLACWYCSCTFSHATGASELEDHAEQEHGPEIGAWVRKMRKVKARRQREWYAASPMGAARHVAELERRAVGAAR